MSCISKISNIIRDLKELNVLKEDDEFSFYTNLKGDKSVDFTIIFTLNREKNNDKNSIYDCVTIITAFKEDFKEADVVEFGKIIWITINPNN